MSVDSVIAQLLDAQDLGSLQVAFRRLCAQFGGVKSTEVLLSGTYGGFGAFCTVRMLKEEAQEQLLRFGFRPLGGRLYLALPLPAHFERRAAIRAA